MASMNLDASLDDMIKAAPRSKNTRTPSAAPKNNRNRGGGGDAPKSRGGGGHDDRGAREAPGVRAKVIAKPRRGPSGGRSVAAAFDDDSWQHDMYQGGGRGGGAPARGANQGGVPQGASGSAKLIISNLHFNVSNQDVKELFEQVGAVKKSGVNFDEQGRSKGSAEVIFARRQDAVQAIKTYNGVKLDGKPLQIELVGGAGAAPPGGMMLSSGITVSARVNSGPGGGSRTVTYQGGAPRGNNGDRSGDRNGGDRNGGDRKKVVAKVVREAGSGRGAGAKGGAAGGRGGKGGRGPKPARAKALTQEELDAQLDSYHKDNKMQE